MKYRSNITAPDLEPAFATTTICKPRRWSMGHDVLSDAVYEPECGFMTHDEAAILYECAMRRGAAWVDIGARLGWTSAHIAKGTRRVFAVDPAYANQAFEERAVANLKKVSEFRKISLYPLTSDEWFEGVQGCFAGVCIDGNHDSPFPLNDARHALANLADTGVIVFHDSYGAPIREGIEYLMSQGLKCRWYDTPNGMAVCWRGDFMPPDHVPDPAIDWAQVRRSRAPEFDFGACQ